MTIAPPRPSWLCVMHGRWRIFEICKNGLRMKFIRVVTIGIAVFASVVSIADTATIFAVSPSNNVPQNKQAAVAQEEFVRGNKLVEWILSYDTVTELMWKKGFDDFRGKIARIEGVVKDVREEKRTFVLLELATPQTSGKPDFSSFSVVRFNLKEIAEEEATNWRKGMKLVMRGKAWRFFNAHYPDGCVEFNESERVQNADSRTGNGEVPAVNTAKQENANAEERANRIVGELIEDELVIRLRFKGYTESECNELKRRLMAKFSKYPVETRVEMARLSINEIVRMYSL